MLHYKHIYCRHCGNYGHVMKYCRDPIKSYGIILINARNELLMVQRKHSIGYCEFIQGHYAVGNTTGIINLFRQMSHAEVAMIKDHEFNYLWNHFWYGDHKRRYDKKCYSIAAEKFNTLKYNQYIELSLDFYVTKIKPFYETTEWGFPKGRKLKSEQHHRDDSGNQACALREFAEETGCNSQNITVINIPPLVERCIGTNGIVYEHILYLAYETVPCEPCIGEHNEGEIADIQWFTAPEALLLVRSYNTSRLEVIRSVDSIMFGGSGETT